MPFVQRFIEPRCLSRTALFDEDGKPKVADGELDVVTNNTLCNALRQLASLVLVANDIFEELAHGLKGINDKSEKIKVRINVLEGRVERYDPKAVTVPESDICTFALLKDHFKAKHLFDERLFSSDTRPKALKVLYDAAAKTPATALRQLDRWRRDGHRSSKFFVCTPVLGAKRRRLRSRVNIDIETSMPAAVEELRRWTSNEALGDVTVTPDCATRIVPNATVVDGHVSDGTIVSDDEGIDHKLPSPEEQLQVVALKFPAEIVAVDVSGRNFDRMSLQRRSLVNPELANKSAEGAAPDSLRRRTRSRRPRNRRRNTLAGTDQKEIRDALTAGEEQSSPTFSDKTENSSSAAVPRSKSSDLLRSSSKKESPENKKSHFNTLKQWGKSRYDKFMNKSAESKQEKGEVADIDDFNLYETVTLKRRRDLDKDRRSHERNSSISSSEKSIPTTSNPITSVMNIAVKLRESSAQRRQRRNGINKDEPHSSSGNWSASSESGRASIGSEITTLPKSTTSAATSSNSLNQQPSSVNSRRRFNVNNSTSSSMTSEGTLTPDIIHDLHEDGETSSVYSCDTEGYYTSFHMDSGLKTLKEEDVPPTPLHSTSAFSNSGSNNTVVSAENEYELFGKGSTSTTTSSAGTVCTTLRASESTKSLVIGPAVPERKSSLSKSPESSLERDFSDKTGTVKRSPATITKPTVVALIHKQQTNNDGDISPDSGHNTSSSPIESISSPNGVRSGSDFEFSESSDMEGPERIERIRVKTAINSSRIPSMCVITPQHSDDESENGSNSSRKDFIRQVKDKNVVNQKLAEEVNLDKDKLQHIITTNVNGSNKLALVNVNPVSGYATIRSIDQPDSAAKIPDGQNKDSTTVPSSIRAPSPSGGTVTVKKESVSKSPSQPIIKASLMPLNNMFGKLKTNLANFASKRDRSKSPNTANKLDENIFDSGEYVTIADVRNNNEKALKPVEEVNYANDVVNKNLKSVLSGKIRDAEYVSLNELPCNDNNNATNNVDSLERKRQGARVTLDAEGRVVYSSDSLRRRKGAHTTFEPGPNVKPVNSPCQSPLPIHRTPKNVRPVNNSQDHNRPLSPHSGKLVISAATTEIVRIPPSTIVAPSARPMSPKSRGAYVNMQDAGPLSPSSRDKKEGAQSPAKHLTQSPTSPGVPKQYCSPNPNEMYHYEDPYLDPAMDTNKYLSSQYYAPRGAGMYSTLPSKKTQYFNDNNTERSVTPDITRGLERREQTLMRFQYQNQHQNLGIPVQMPDINRLNLNQVPYLKQQSYEDINESLRISPIDPRHSGSFKSSTPSYKTTELKATSNLESKLMSPKKSTMSNEELYAVIHKSKKKMNIEADETPRSSPVTVQSDQSVKQTMKTPESGYLDRSKSRLSWSPSNGEYVEFNNDIDKLSPPNDSRTRQSWACTDRTPKVKQTSTIDFKRLLLQKSTTSTPKKLSAVEQLKLSKQQIKSPQPKVQPEMNILDLSGSPRSLVNRRFLANNAPGSPNRDPKSVAKVLSPRSQWRFANPRTDVLSSTILEDCREDESPNSSGEKRSPRNRSRDSPKKDGSPRTYQRQESPNIAESLYKEATTPKKSSPKGMPRYETTPYSSASQRLYAQRAQFFQPINRSPEGEKKTAEPCSPPTLETAF